MKAKEFIPEGRQRIGKMQQDTKEVMPTGIKFAGTADRIYDLHRTMMAAACSDGRTMAHPVDEESWIGRNNYFIAYTPVEQAMMDHAFKHLNIEHQYTVRGPSTEPKDTNKQSPVPKQLTARKKG